MARAVLGVAVQRQVREHEPEAVGRAPRPAARTRGATGRRSAAARAAARPGLAVGDPRAVVVVVEAQLHGRGPIVESEARAAGRSPHDREILRLAFPALGALAAEPLYVLVDTAIVGHLGTTQLASLAIAATVLGTAFTIFNFLTYGTTAQVARMHGAGRGEEAAGSARRRSGSRCSSARRCSWRSRALARPLVTPDGWRGRGRGRRDDLPADRRARRARVHARERRPGLPARHR